MFPELIQQLIDKNQYPLLLADDVNAFIGKHRHSVLFFCNDAKLFPESLDVAVILPELMVAFKHAIVPAIISRDDEMKVQRNYGFTTWPSLVFFKDGNYLGAISKVQDWDDYINTIQKLLLSEPTTPPIKIALKQN
ncbi:hydrogenase-1 expression HyaE [Bathymodiolus azoricus thioautotrophic gill symbiont]|jgi:hydrogenase-1 operon protein HyaE|nr:hydrogenase-1 expression HyaE [Bathymodiolus azoricus thioautotrophic gill symbiont]